MNKKILAAALATPLCQAGITLAENSLVEETVITSSRVEMPLRQIGTSVSVINRNEIQQRGFTSLFDILRSQPSVGVSNNGGAGKVTALRIRGEESYRTLVLLDGVDISDTSTPQVTPRIEYLLSSGIQRVEILRGPQGLMYGADAGGVVNITTLRREDGMGGQVSAEGGRYGSQQFAGDFGWGNDTFDFNLSAADFQTDGFNARTTDQDIEDDDGYDNTTLHGNFGWNVSEDFRLSLVARNVDGDTDYDSCFSPVDFSSTNRCKDEFEQDIWRIAADYEGERFSHEVFYSDSETKRDTYADGQFSARFDGEIERYGYLGSFRQSEALRFVYGVDLETESSDGTFLKGDRDQEGYYLEYQGGFNDRFFVTAGARYDDNDDFGTHTSYRSSAAYLIPTADGEVKLKATYGTGFRAPSLSEIATNMSPFTGPPTAGLELSEEESDGYDIGVSWLGNNGGYLEAVYFNQTISDEIVFDFNSFGYFQADGDTESEGIELIGEWPIQDAWMLSSNYTYNDSQNFNNDKRPRRPEHLANLGIEWSPMAERLRLGLNFRLSHDAEDIDGSAMDDYEVVDLNARFFVRDGLEIFGRIENLLDEDYEEVPTYNTSGTAAYAGLRYSF